MCRSVRNREQGGGSGLKVFPPPNFACEVRRLCRSYLVCGRVCSELVKVEMGSSVAVVPSRG